MDQFLKFAPWIISSIMFYTSCRLFVTPEQLEKKHREILCDCEKKFASLTAVNDLKSQFGEMKQKIDQIYEILLARK
jgi:hypothetical protein